MYTLYQALSGNLHGKKYMTFNAVISPLCMILLIFIVWLVTYCSEHRDLLKSDPDHPDAPKKLIQQQQQQQQHPSLDYKAIVSFSFGLGRGNTPGASNEALAQHIIDVLSNRKTQKEQPLPLLLVQWEIAVAINETLDRNESSSYPAAIQQLLRHPTHVAWPLPKSYLSTSGVLTQFRAHLTMLRRGFNNKKANHVPVYLVAHRDHFPRCKRLLEAYDAYRVVNARSSVPDVYDPESTQTWTRNRKVFVAHEKSLGFSV
eukprot:PhM_4_TR16001/c0_g1_i1/m.54640